MARQHVLDSRGTDTESPGKVCGYVGFTAEMEHKIIAGADMEAAKSESLGSW